MFWSRYERVDLFIVVRMLAAIDGPVLIVEARLGGVSKTRYQIPVLQITTGSNQDSRWEYSKMKHRVKVFSELTVRTSPQRQ